MKDQAAAYLDKAGETLDDARKSLEASIHRQAARLAYFTAFHAAQALIFERVSKAAKTHKGVDTQFAKIAREEMLDQALPQFLGAAYHFKEAAAYETGSLRTITADDAAKALHGAEHFVSAITVVLEHTR